MKTVKTFSLLFFTAQSSLHCFFGKSTIQEPTLTSCF